MAPYFACFGEEYWQDETDPARNWYADIALGGHADFGAGATPGTYTMVASGYGVRPNLPLPGQIGLPAVLTVNGEPAFAGVAEADGGFLQSYPSKRQNPTLTPASEMNWILDTHHYNPSYGAGAESGLGLFDNKETNIRGTVYDPSSTTSQVWKMTLPGLDQLHFKQVGFVGWAGWHMLGDMSGPGSLIGDTNSYKYCYAYFANECRPGSAAGDIFVSVPASIGSCVVN